MKPKVCQWCKRKGTRQFQVWNGKPECSATWACGQRSSQTRPAPAKNRK